MALRSLARERSIPRHAGEGRTIRLLWLIDSLTAGGAESLVAPFARAWPGELEVCCLKSIGGNPFEAEVRATNLQAKNLRDLGAFRRLLRLLRRERIELIHAHLAYASLWGALASRITGIPCVATLHVAPSGAPLRSKEGIREALLVHALNRWAKQVIAVSDSAREAWIERGLKRVVVVGNGIEVDSFTPTHHRGKVVTTVSVLREGKGIEVLLGAIPAVLAKHPDARFLIAGDGPLRKPLEARGPNAAWLGFRRDVPELLAASDLFVLPSLGDAYPTVLMEAMAAGLPVVSTRVGGIPEIVDDGRTGILVPPGDATALAGAISDLLDSRERREVLGQAARAAAERRFSTAAWVKRLAEVYGPRLAVVEFAGRGGMIHYAWQLCRALAGTGADVTLITSRHYELDALPHPFRLQKVLRLWDPKPAGGSSGHRKLRRVGRAFLHYREWLRLAFHLRRERPDLVLLGDIRFPGDLAPILLLRMLGLRLADVCHNVAPYAAGGFRRSALDRFLYRRIYRCFERVFVHFEDNRRAFLADYGLPPERVVAIPHGNEAIFEELRDPKLDEARLRRELGLAPDEPVLLLLGTLSHYKGIDLLLKAFALVAPRARLVLAGFPAADFDLAAHQALAPELGIEDRVLWVPRYVESEEIAAWMGLASVAVFPYREVFQSGALAIAQTFGVPVVASAVGAMPEAVGGSGLLVPPGDPEALASALLSVLEDPDLARRLGERARQDARERFAWERIGMTIVEGTR
ncbi:MAG: glycosyltransferase family 4 protein [Thermoanaerobaculia bacterium]